MGLQEGPGEPCGGGRQGGEKGQVHHPWSRDDKDPYEASNQGWEERGVRQDDDGEGEASEDGREGLLRGCSEECGLSWWGDEVCVGLLRSGPGYNGSTCCSTGFECTSSGPYYSGCQPKSQSKTVLV